LHISDLLMEMAPKYTIFRHFSKVEKHDLPLTSNVVCTNYLKKFH
jgi:hypothetical protein